MGTLPRFLTGALLAAACIIAQAAEETKAIEVTAENFSCVTEMTPVRGFFVDNLLGDLEATLAVANSATGGAYPVGSVVQLVPGEVMVKHPKGVSPATNDWEFFELTVSPAGSTIAKRGFVDVNNKFGGNCFACHVKAEPQWDLVCETGHGCDPLPLTRQMLDVIQKTDPRCKNPPALSEEEKAVFAQLQKILK